MPKSKKAKDVAINRVHNVTRLTSGDQLVEVETTTTTYPRELEWADVRAAVEFKPDEWGDPPWHDCDGWEHDVVDPAGLEGYNPDHAFYDRGRRRLVVVRPEVARHWGSAYPGAAKQVVAEAKARELARSYEKLVDWYRNGWQVYGVVCEFLGEEASVWGVYADDGDAYLEEVGDQEAAEVCAALEKRGFEILGAPDRQAGYRENRRWHRKASSAMAMGFKDPKAYQAWLSAGPLPLP